MPGAWEYKPAVLVGILHTEATTVAWSFGLRNLIVPGAERLPQGGFLPLAGLPYDHGRNQMCMNAIEWGATHIFMLDSDVIPPRDTINRLLQHNLPVVSGMYCRRSPPHGLPVMMKNGRWHTEFQPGSLVEVDVVGAGCLLIRRDVLQALPPIKPGRHWFSWQVDQKGVLPPEECMSEDYVFCHAVRKKLGVKIMVDTSIRCRHAGGAEADLMSFNPLSTNPVT